MFKNISHINNLKLKKFFIELVELHIKLIDAFVIKNNIKYKECALNKKVVDRLIDLEIIKEKEELEGLKKMLKEDLFNSFISSINFSNKHKEKIGDLLFKLEPKKRKEKQLNEKRSKKPVVVDFFSGAGGLSLGFTQEGYKIDFANDFEDVCVQTYKYNHPEVPENRVIQGDIRGLVNDINNHIKKDIDVIVGGPPCQGFSSANQQRIIDDPRNELYKYFIQMVQTILPKFVVMENVRGMLPYADQIVEDYNTIKVKKQSGILTYNVAYSILISDDFGVAQRRQRLFFIAIRSDISKELDITPENIFSQIKKSTQNNKKHILQDALDFIKPLDSPRVKNMTNIDDENTGKKVFANKFNGNENSYLKLINQNRKINYIYNHKARYANEINYQIYDRLEPGEDATSDKIKDIMPYKHRNHVFKDKYYKLIPTKPSRTITAHLRMDCHSHIHPSQTRSITPREAARIQSFPDDYLFLGAYLKTYMQIGNAVPPMMARGIAKIIKKHIN